MVLYQNFVFFDEESTGGTSRVFVVPPEAEHMAIHVTELEEDTYTLKPQGRTDTKDGGWVDLSVIDSSALDVVDKIEAEGLFDVSISGIKELRFTSTGTPGKLKVHGVAK